MKKTRSKKLNLSTQTLRNLERAELVAIEGAAYGKTQRNICSDGAGGCSGALICFIVW